MACFTCNALCTDSSALSRIRKYRETVCLCLLCGDTGAEYASTNMSANHITGQTHNKRSATTPRRNIHYTSRNKHTQHTHNMHAQVKQSRRVRFVVVVALLYDDIKSVCVAVVMRMYVCLWVKPSYVRLGVCDVIYARIDNEIQRCALSTRARVIFGDIHQVARWGHISLRFAVFIVYFICCCIRRGNG